MHPLLQPILPTGITIVLWCVCSAATALVQPVKNNEPPPQHQPEPKAAAVSPINLVSAPAISTPIQDALMARSI
jgi:hypothetical protein